MTKPQSNPDFMPLYSAPGIKNDKSWIFQLRSEGIGQDVRVNNYSKEIEAILTLSNGLNSVRQIAQALEKEGKDPSLVKTIISNLSVLGVLVDSREIYKQLHLSTLRPTPFEHNLSHQDIGDITDHDTFSKKAGKSLRISARPTRIGKLSLARKSSRSFSAEPLSSELIVTCLDNAYSAEKRPVPSAGGLYPLRFYIIARNASDLSTGYYQYDHTSGQLIHFHTLYDDEKVKFALDDEECLHAAAIIVIAADLERQPAKYANRGYRFTLLEAGHAAQNIHLSAQELGIASLEYGGFQDSQLATELGLKENESPLIVIALGHQDQPTAKSLSTTDIVFRLEQYIGTGKPVEWVYIKNFTPDMQGLDMQEALSQWGAPQPDLTDDEQRLAGGSARSSELAYIKAVAEAYERYMSGKFRFDVKAAASELSEPWLSPETIKPLTDKQYAKLTHLEKFDPDKPIQWIRGNQHDGSPILVPVDLVFYPLDDAILGRKLTVEADSSGVAAHTSFYEAAHNGLLELLERDALMKTWINKKPPRRIATSALPHHYQNRAKHWEKQNRKMEVLDLSHDGIAVVLVIVRSLSGDYPYMTSGAGASSESFAAALDKAAQEAEPTYSFEQHNKNKKDSLKPEEVTTTDDHGVLYYYDNHRQEVDWLWSKTPTTRLPKINRNQDIEQMYQPITIRLSPEEDFLQVVRVLCPKLVPISFGFGNEHFSHPSLKAQSDSIIPHFFP